MKLYLNDWAPSPRRVVLYLAEKGISVDRQTIDLGTNEHLSPEFLGINPRGTLPALILDDGTCLTESVAICRYFEALYPAPALFGAMPHEVALVEEWIRRVEQEGYAACSYALRNSASMFHDRALPNAVLPIPQIPALVERGQIMWSGFLGTLEKRLAQNTWLAGDHFSFADIVALTTVDFARVARLPAPEGPATVAWRAAITARTAPPRSGSRASG